MISLIPDFMDDASHPCDASRPMFGTVLIIDTAESLHKRSPR